MEDVGATQTFVLAEGFETVEDYAALIAADGSRRLLAELSADPDLPGVRPQEAYRALLAALQPGWRLRLLQLVWPDPGPRLAFQAQVEAWGGGGEREGPESDGRALLREGLLVHLEEAPLPFVRRTVLEIALVGEAGLAWWGALPGLLADYGVGVTPLGAEEVTALARRIFNPELE